MPKSSRSVRANAQKGRKAVGDLAKAKTAELVSKARLGAKLKQKAAKGAVSYIKAKIAKPRTGAHGRARTR